MSKELRNIENEHCYFGLNCQVPSVTYTTLLVLATDFWIVGALNLIGPMPYFASSLLLLSIKVLIHLRPSFYIGKIQFAIRTLSNLLFLSIFCTMLVLYLTELQISLPV
jgi:hypothetical protein